MYEFTKKELNVYETKYNLNFDQSEISYIALYLASIFETGVQEDLKAGDRVIVDGILKVTPGTPVKIVSKRAYRIPVRSF